MKSDNTLEPRMLPRSAAMAILHHVAFRMAAQCIRYDIAERIESAARTASRLAAPKVEAAELIGLFKLLGVEPGRLADLLQGTSPYKGPRADQDWAPMLEQMATKGEAPTLELVRPSVLMQMLAHVEQVLRHPGDDDPPEVRCLPAEERQVLVQKTVVAGLVAGAVGSELRPVYGIALMLMKVDHRLPRLMLLIAQAERERWPWPVGRLEPLVGALTEVVGLEEEP